MSKEITPETVCEHCGYEDKYVWVTTTSDGKQLCDSCAMIHEHYLKVENMP